MIPSNYVGSLLVFDSLEIEDFEDIEELRQKALANMLEAYDRNKDQQPIQ